MCESSMHLKSKIRLGINGRWRCHKKICRKTKSFFENTMFDSLYIPISKILRIIYMHFKEIRTKYIAEKIDVTRQTIYTIIDRILFKVDSGIYDSLYSKLGPEDIIIELDETLICTKRDGRERILQKGAVWIFGAICKRT